MAQAILCVIGTCFFYLSMVGWGWWLMRLLKVSRPADMGLLAAWGLALSVIFGGIFNLCGIISVTLVRCYLFLGALAFIFYLFSTQYQNHRSWRTRIRSIFQDPLTVFLFIVLVTLLASRVASAGFKSFNIHDDFYSYLVMPIKMIQTGSIEATAFNERRMSVLGGQSFLHALMMGLLDIRHLNIVDLGLGWLVLTGLIAGHALQQNNHVKTTLCFLLVCQFIRIPTVNASSVITGCALFYAFIRTILLMKKEVQLSRVLMISIMITGLCSLKNSYFIICAIFPVLFLITDPDHHFFENGKTMIIVGFATCIFLLPWMLNLYQNNGTFLFPILGQGFQGGAYGNYPSVAVGELTFGNILSSTLSLISKSIFFLGLLLVLMNIVQKRDFANSIFILILFFSTWSSGLILLITSGGLIRYLFPFICATTIFLFVDYISFRKPSERNTVFAKLLFIALLFTIFLFGFRGFSGVYMYNFKQFFRYNLDTQWSDKDRIQIRTAQAAVPRGEKILSRLSKPFLMDFSLNSIFVIDSPCAASQPPGLPCFGNPDGISQYLRLKKFNFLMYSYKDEAGFPRKKYQGWTHLKGRGYNSRVRIATLHAFAFQQRLNTLAEQYPKVYDDGDIFVLRFDS